MTEFFKDACLHLEPFPFWENRVLGMPYRDQRERDSVTVTNASSSPMTEYDLSFSPSSSTDGGSYKLVELPPELCQIIENAIDSMNPLRCVIF